ncbi:MAG: histidine kinase dimerization/phospho-acceptor domain-containing protein [Xanthobacteraceae bacterium]
MSETEHLAFVREPRLAALATAPLPAWVWSVGSGRLVWANAVGAAIFGAPTVSALTERRFDADHPAALQVARLAISLPPPGRPRLERLRGFAPRVGGLLTCSCVRLPQSDGPPAILIAATEPAGPSLSLAERVRRLFDGQPFAVFVPEGGLLHATPEATRALGGATTLAAAGAAELAATALQTGHAAGQGVLGPFTLDRLGSDDTAVLVVTLPASGETAAAVRPPAEPLPAEPVPADRPQQAIEVTAAAQSGTLDGPAVSQAPESARPPDPAAAAAERRQPLRFVWQIDAEGRFSVASDEFIALMGPAIASMLQRPWTELAAELGLDQDGRVGQALASRDTFSGIAVAWPIEGTPDRLPVELSGLPIFDHGRSFRGYRGFGVCRDMARVAAIAAARRPPFVAPVETAGPGSGTEPGTYGEPPADKLDPQAAPRTPTSERPLLTVVPAAKNVVPFRPAVPVAADKRPALTPVEHNAFQEIAKALGARVQEDAAEPPGGADVPPAEPAEDAPAADEGAMREPRAPLEDDGKRPGTSGRIWPRSIPSAYATGKDTSPTSAQGNGERAVLDRLPVGVLIFRGDQVLVVNRAVLDWTGYESTEAVVAAGGLERLLAEPGLAVLGEPGSSGRSLAIVTRRGASLPVEGRLFSVPWHDGTALLIVLVRVETDQRIRAAEDAVRAAERRVLGAEAALAGSDERVRSAELALRAAQQATRELESVLETATDGVLVVDRDGRIVASNRSAEALFGYESHEITNRSFVDLFAPESHRAAHEYLDGLVRAGVASVLNDGREVIGRVREGGLIPLFITIGRLADEKFCIVFRDVTQWKRAEEDLTNAKREAEKASSAKSDFLAKVSHEIRTPLNAIIGFAEVMVDERFGPLGNERYRQYLKDIRTSGEHVISLVNDLLDLSKIEAGKLELTFVSVSLNDVVQQCVAIMQPQANRERIIIRTSLLPTLPPVVADERSIRQIVLNLLSNSIKFTGAGGQVIVSTALTDRGEAVLRVRDTGIGMSEKEIETALEPFRQVATSGRSGSGTGLGLPLTKVLAEANRATFTIKSAVDAGTLVEIAFPGTRVLAE